MNNKSLTELQTYCIMLLLSIKTGLIALYGEEYKSSIESINYDADGLISVIKFEGKEYQIKITPK